MRSHAVRILFPSGVRALGRCLALLPCTGQFLLGPLLHPHAVADHEELGQDRAVLLPFGQGELGGGRQPRVVIGQRTAAPPVVQQQQQIRAVLERRQMRGVA